MDVLANIKAEGVLLKDLFKEEFDALLNAFVKLNEENYKGAELYYNNTALYMRFKEDDKAKSVWDKYLKTVGTNKPGIYETEREQIEAYFSSLQEQSSILEKVIVEDIKANYKFYVESPDYEILEIKVTETEKIMNQIKYSGIMEIKMKVTGQEMSIPVAGVVTEP